MKILLTFPPLWDLNLGPMLSLPVLSGMLRKEGHDVCIIDTNSYLMNFLLSKDFFKYFEKKKDFYKTELEKLQNNHEEYALYSNDLKYAISKYFTDLSRLFENYKEYLYEPYIKKYPSVKTCMEALFREYNKNFNDLCKMFRALLNKFFKINYLKNIPRKYLLFTDWEDNFLFSKIKDFAPDIIGFSIYCEIQYLWSKNYSEFLKNKLNPFIIFGGTEITQIRNSVAVEDFKNHADVMIYGEGETAFTLLAAKTALSKIPSIIYVNKKGNIKINKQKIKDVPVKINFHKPDYTNINIGNYFVPKPVLQIESSRGCYWHKCKFCTFMDCIPYKIKKADDLIEEIKEYVNKYHINHFFFTDAAIHPNYAKEFSQKLIENNLKIYYTTCLRLEKEFDEDLLKLMYDTGLRMVMWGVESGSDRILKLYNKGTKAKNNAKILKLAHDIGIYNYCWFITQFAKETIEDMDLTYKFFIDNYDNIDFVSHHIFTLMPNSPISDEAEDFGLKKEDFKVLELYHAPIEISVHSDEIINKIMNTYKEKMDSYPYDISYILLKRAYERP